MQRKHAFITCLDPKLNPTLTVLERSIEEEGGLILPHDRTVGGVHAMTHSNCRRFFYDQLDGLIHIFGVNVLHVFPHTKCRFNGLKQWEKIGKTPGDDLQFQVDTLQKAQEGASDHVRSTFPDHDIELDFRIILTEEQRIITLEEALDLLPHHHAHDGSCRHSTPLEFR